MVKNDDVGFVYPHQKVKIKLAAYPFQQYGMLDGEVLTIGADADPIGDGDDEHESDASADDFARAIGDGGAELLAGYAALQASIEFCIRIVLHHVPHLGFTK